MTERLAKFLSAYLAWVDSGAHTESFTRRKGLCSNFHHYLFGVCQTMDEIEEEDDKLKDLFISDGLDSEFPFGGEELYFEEIEREIVHLNPERLAWVRSKVEQFATANAK